MDVAAIKRLEALPRVRLGEFPTRLQPAEGVSRLLGGPDIWFKREDLVGLGLGGNKVRKLELLLAEALAQGADTVITCGAAQSNHARLTAAAARRLGLQPYLVLRGDGAEAAQGNLLLDRLLGAEIHWAPGAAPAELMEAARQLAIALRNEGRRPYVVPYGGSGPLGTLAYALASLELARQGAAQGLVFDAVITASSSGATQAGLVLGQRLAGLSGPIWGMSADLSQTVLGALAGRLAGEAAAVIGAEPPPQADVIVFDRYIGDGYGKVNDACREALA
ncbi:MAG: pyridoxal-phosphate dependent enzyme, partial [Chloroflexi bacterium]|nr:pyridoxal-phosphate dependent enzyme [Chloroflexota bacterium]